MSRINFNLEPKLKDKSVLNKDNPSKMSYFLGRKERTFNPLICILEFVNVYKCNSPCLVRTVYRVWLSLTDARYYRYIRIQYVPNVVFKVNGGIHVEVIMTKEDVAYA